eukprot:CAMPEP_0197073512 /NCGR_PEP_ID=MMETSP1384-20130603/210642_1 /TAXON_ID=29189 /ORGANISM="Ammonia sp." /LENGTH=775 /DNA_ID=CAMNT_0042512349 /DNA_START=103 /DNA_END=2431 /DNA_ORIENTATION=+
MSLNQDTPDDEAVDSQGSNASNTQPTGTPSEQSESIWGRLIPVYTNHEEPSLNQVFEFRESVVNIGRNDSNDVVLKCPNISGNHCKIERHEADAEIPDNIFFIDQSSNGTWLNKQKVHKKRVLLEDGAEIMLVPASKKKKRKKLSFFFHLEDRRKKSQLLAKSDRTGSTLESKYYIIKELGKGAFSTVKLVQHRETREKFALKIIDRVSWQRMKHATKRNVKLLDEVEIMQKANHPNIVKVHEFFPSDDIVNVILDFCDGGDMLEYIQDHGPYDSSKGRMLFKQLIEAVDYLHSLKIAHRDLKPDNILLTDKEGATLKISDFGISREQTSAGCGTIIGTPLYQAPEVHQRRSQFPNGYDGILADYWSLGIILYVMMVAAPPISTQESTSKICQMSENQCLPWYDEPIPETAKDLIYKLLQTDPSKRITAKDIYKHPWILGYDRFDDVPTSTSSHKEPAGEEEMKVDSNCSSSNGETAKHVQDQLDSISLTKNGSADSKQEEEETLQNTHKQAPQPQPQAPLPALSATCSANTPLSNPPPHATPCLSSSIEKQCDDEDDDVAMNSPLKEQKTSNGEEQREEHKESEHSTLGSQPQAPLPALSATCSANTPLSNPPPHATPCLSSSIEKQCDDEDDDVAMNSPLKEQKTSNGEEQRDEHKESEHSTLGSGLSTMSSLSSSSSSSRKRRAHFDDEDCDDLGVAPPPIKKQKSDRAAVENGERILMMRIAMIWEWLRRRLETEKRSERNTEGGHNADSNGSSECGGDFGMRVLIENEFA